MQMELAEEMARVAREVIAAYEARVVAVGHILEATHEMLETFRYQREAIRAQLREALSRAASLRRRDFDAMMQTILARQAEREGAVKETIRGYLTEQKTLATALKDALTGGEAEQIEATRGLLEQILSRWEVRELEVKTLLAEYRSEHAIMVKTLAGLLSNGGPVRVKEFKATLSAIQSRHWACRENGGNHEGNGGRVPAGEESCASPGTKRRLL